MEYAIRILQITLFEWEGIKERNNIRIHQQGPYQEAQEAIKDADEKIPQLKAAITLLKSPPKQ